MTIDWEYDVARFHEVTDAPDLKVPGFPGMERVDLREKLVSEETKEFLEGLAARDLVEVADGIIDSIYVLVGTALEFGLPIHALWDEVQRSNMAKAVLQPDGTFKVMRRADGKILKPEGWTPPDIEGVLRAHGWKGPEPKVRAFFQQSKVFQNRCENCSQKRIEHEWVCQTCGQVVPWETQNQLPGPGRSCACGELTLSIESLFCPEYMPP
jgi:predicted HAD superfamily Cof-like phosphohydrolase